MNTIKSMQCLNLNTRRSVQVDVVLSGRECQSKQEFSFNRQILCSHQNILKQKYSQIYNDLKILNSNDITQLLLQQLEQNQKFKKQIFNKNNRIEALEVQVQELKDTLKKKREAINLLCQTESKNLQLIQKLQNKISKKNELGRDTHYQKKYQQLSLYTNQYIRNINSAQQQFLKAHHRLKSQNIRLSQTLQCCQSESLQQQKKHQITAQKLKKAELELQELRLVGEKQLAEIGILREELEILRGELEVVREGMRITDRLEVHIAREHCQLSSQLDFIRDKICENQSISKDIIQRLEESSANCDRASKDKLKYFQSLQRSKDKCTGIQKQLNTLRAKNQELQQDIKLIKKQYDIIANERDDLQEDLLRQRLEKQSIREQLLGLADKVKLMQSTYKKQIQQSQKIKGQLFKFWQNKQKKDSMVRQMSTKVLTEVKQNGCEYSQTTLVLSQKQSKMSVWNKKNDLQTSFNMYDKENNEQNQSKDSLCS